MDRHRELEIWLSKWIEENVYAQAQPDVEYDPEDDGLKKLEKDMIEDARGEFTRDEIESAVDDIKKFIYNAIVSKWNENMKRAVGR